jgi:hypothetical protein
VSGLLQEPAGAGGHHDPPGRQQSGSDDPTVVVDGDPPERNAHSERVDRTAPEEHVERADQRSRTDPALAAGHGDPDRSRRPSRGRQDHRRMAHTARAGTLPAHGKGKAPSYSRSSQEGQPRPSPQRGPRQVVARALGRSGSHVVVVRARPDNGTIITRRRRREHPHAVRPRSDRGLTRIESGDGYSEPPPILSIPGRSSPASRIDVKHP